MTISRREFTLALGAGTLGLSKQNPEAPVTAERARAMLREQTGASIFQDEAWLELFRRAVELNAETRRVLRDYELSADVEPAITFLR